MQEINTKIAQSIAMDGVPDFKYLDMHIPDLLFVHRIDVTNEGMTSTTTVPTKLAKPKIPKGLSDLIKKWDDMRRQGKVPKAQQIAANKIRKLYIQKLKELFKKEGIDFVRGKVYDLKAVEELVQKAGKIAYSRAKMTVETESTRYFNEARTMVYDKSPDVTHYLFMSIRDHATTKWCKTRHGLVFTKGTELFRRNQPPCHWYCRSEVLPLTPHNPNHLRLIQDMSKRAENNKLEPLPAGWNAA